MKYVFQSLNSRLRLPLLLASLLSACAHEPVAPEQPIQAILPEEPAKDIFKPFPDDSFYDLLVAEFAIRRQQYPEALSRYMQQAEATGDISVIETAARLAQFTSDYNAALTATQLWLDKQPDSAEAHFIRASALAQTRRPTEALQHMEQVIGSDREPNFASLAANALSLSEPEQKTFADTINALLVKHPDNLPLKVGVALMLQYRNQEEQALALIDSVLAERPNDLHSLLIETRLLQQLGRIDEAIERLKFAVDRFPTHKRLRLNLAQLLSQRDLYQAKAQYTVLLNQYPQDNNIALSLALVDRELGNYDEASELLGRLVNDPAQSQYALYFLGRIAEQEKRWQDAINFYRQIQEGEQLVPAYTHIAEISNEQFGLDKARATLADARKRFPNWEVQLYLIESDLLFEHRRYEEGHSLLSKALQDYPGDTSLLYARSLFSERRKNLALMEQDLRTIIDNDPENASALNALGYSLAIMTDRLEEARALVDKALKLRPEDPAIQDSYGWIAFRLGDLQLARNYLQKAFDQSEDHEIAAHLGEVLWKLGQPQQAKLVWQKGLKNKPDSPIIQETLKRLNVTLPGGQ